MFEHCEGMKEGNIALIDEHITDYQPNTHGLLVANHQLREETLSCIGRLEPKYHVDAIWNPERLRPTWTWIPTVPVRNEPVNLTITLTYDARCRIRGLKTSLHIFI